MELRQLRYFVRIVELGSMGRAAQDLGLVQSALSQQMSRLEAELGAKLLQRTVRGVAPTAPGMAFFREAQVTLRHAQQAMRSARQASLSGAVSVGLSPTTAAVLGLPLMQAMRQRYPEVRLHLVEAMPLLLRNMLNRRTLDLAVLFDWRQSVSTTRREGQGWQATPLLDEFLYLIQSRPSPLLPAAPDAMPLAQLGSVPLVLPTGAHGLRQVLDDALATLAQPPQVALEVDSLSLLVAAVEAGLAATVYPWSAVLRSGDAPERLRCTRITDTALLRTNLLCSLAPEELSSAALATRVVLLDCVRTLTEGGLWQGVVLRAPV